MSTEKIPLTPEKRLSKIAMIITIPVQLEIPDDCDIEHVAICRDGTPMAFTRYAEPRKWNGMWEKTRQYSTYISVANWEDTLTKVER